MNASKMDATNKHLHDVLGDHVELLFKVEVISSRPWFSDGERVDLFALWELDSEDLQRVS